ncbi:MAG: glycerophosphodiester phosphodiesterase [Planctomycetes bacterium]|nr:glycerophosphodiester phosphodiesterase [Planctomycetota bacterium]MCH9725422.1 glycerophosphodiester phosphodiesterase [Planctomycetota bacterium]MCH9776519.1 glycerophosphodiester phosphodiesterase [Planctomycetota bacterium]MDF1742102.1 glycerophosphodiester phosphodiesterase [Gimesia sp.]
MSATTSLSAVEIIGHRGASHDAPENTLASVNLAWERNADAVEIDIYLTKDGQIVAYHDKTTKRIGGRDQEVKEQTFAELQTLDVGAWKHSRYKQERIPTLAQILKTIPDHKRLFIEIKCGAEVLPRLKKDLADSGKKSEQTAIIGFDYETMKQAKRVLPELKVFWVFKVKQNKLTRKWAHNADYYIQKAKTAHLDGLDIGFNNFVTQDFVNRAKSADLPVYVWTVNSVRDARNLVNMGVEGITTDRPGLLNAALKAAK